MANPREHLEDWLRDAYAMERQAEMLLAAQLKRLDHYPQRRIACASISTTRSASRRSSKRA